MLHNETEEEYENWSNGLRQRRKAEDEEDHRGGQISKYLKLKHIDILRLTRGGRRSQISISSIILYTYIFIIILFIKNKKPIYSNNR